MRIVVLETDIFDDRETIEKSLQVLAATHQLLRYNLCGDALTDEHGDRIMAAVVAGDTVVTV